MLYWIIVTIGLLDLEFFDFDFDGLEPSGVFSGLFVFLNVAQLPFMLFLSILALNFWVLSMLIYFLPIVTGGLFNGLLLIPCFVISMFLTKYETIPLKGIFKESNQQEDRSISIVHGLCRLRCAIHDGRLGQAEVEVEVEGERTSIVIQVKPDSELDVFEKGEVAFIGSEDTVKNVYYIIKLRGVEK